LGSRPEPLNRREIAKVFPLYDDNPFKLPVKPVVTWSLIAANIVAFIIEVAGTDDSMQAIVDNFGVTPAVLVGGKGGLLAGIGTLFTYMFLHANLMHILGNMVFLWVFGDDIEEALGRARFLLFYVACGVVGGVVFVASDPAFQGPLIGASGAISGVVIAYVMFRPCAKITVLFSIIPLRIRAYWVVGAFVVTQFLSLEAAGKSDVAYWCHLGGMAAGLVLFPLMRLPGVQLFECVAHPHYPGDPAAAQPLERDPRG
jgi:membrane associated rhomboid family serine protease